MFMKNKMTLMDDVLDINESFQTIINENREDFMKLYINFQALI